MNWNRSLPAGTKDKLFIEAFHAHHLENLVNHHFRERGYQRIETPLIEFEDVFQPMDQKSTSMYRFFDEKNRIVVLRPDMTLPIGRVISTNGVIPPLKLYYSGKIFRLNKYLSGEYNEVLQAGMELIGYDSLKAELECITNAIAVSNKIKLPNFHIELGHADIYQAVVREMNFSKKNEKQFRLLLKSKSISGMKDFLKNYQNHSLFPLVSKLPRLFGGEEIIEEALSLTTNQVITSALEDIQMLIFQVKRIYPNQEITIDVGLVQDFKYYTGIIFKGYADHSSDFFLSGGRYDRLMTEFNSQNLPAVGLAFHLDSILKIQNKNHAITKPADIQVLIHYDNESLLEAEKILALEPNSTLSLYDCLTDTFLQGATWKIPKVIYLSSNGKKEYRLCEESNTYELT